MEMKRIGPLLIAVALIAGMVGCGPVQYNLTISSTEGGQVTTPGEGAFTYDEGTVVSLVAHAEGGYSFVGWSGDVGTVGDVNAVVTNININDNYDIAANFEETDPGTLFEGGSGTVGDPYQIANWSHLNNIRDYLDDHFILLNDLRVITAGYAKWASPTANQGKGWQPIGTFTGTFDGQAYKVRDLFIDRPDENNVGLFGFAGEEGCIEDIGVVNVTVTGNYYVGALVGMNDGAVNNSYSTGNLHGTADIGGLVGANHHAGAVSNSSSTASVTATSWPYAGAAGGLVGSNSYGGSVINSSSIGSVTGDRYIGGLVGVNSWDSTVSDSYSTGSVTGDMNVGGLVGYISDGSTVSNSYYNYDDVLINSEKIITIGALFSGDFEQWLANDKFLDINERLPQEDGYYVISDVTDFKELLAFGQNGTLKFRLTNDLDLVDEANFYIPYLAGEFDGNGHKASALSLNFNLASLLGLFGYLAPDGKVTHMSVENTNITGWIEVGGLVGSTWEGTISDCHSTGSVTGVSEGDEPGSFIGGLVGQSMHGTISNSYFTGTVTGSSNVGGLVGQNYGTLSNSYSSGSVSGIEGTVGGLVGVNGDAGTVSNSYSTATVTSEHNAGGLVGENYGTVSKSYSTGSVTGDHNIGGLMGANYGHVGTSYSTGSVTGSSSVGGLVGVNGYGGSVSDSFWDTETSGQATSDGGTGKTTMEMQEITTFSGAGWDIIGVADLGTHNPAYIWNIVSNITYPFLSWQS
jgi:hypothetical protein